jgi:hypothetical protein
MKFLKSKFMSKYLILTIFVISSFTAAGAQTDMNSKGEPVAKNEQNAPVNLKPGERIVRGIPLSKTAKKVTVERAFANPEKFAGQSVSVDGVVVRSCKKEGCWMEIADKPGGKSVRVTFGDHAFFIPLNSAGMTVKAEGKFVTKILPKDHVDHLINDDGAKFDKRNPDGTVTEVSFDATGVVLTKASEERQH